MGFWKTVSHFNSWSGRLAGPNGAGKHLEYLDWHDILIWLNISLKQPYKIIHQSCKPFNWSTYFSTYCSTCCSTYIQTIGAPEQSKHFPNRSTSAADPPIWWCVDRPTEARAKSNCCDVTVPPVRKQIFNGFSMDVQWSFKGFSKEFPKVAIGIKWNIGQKTWETKQGTLEPSGTPDSHESHVGSAFSTIVTSSAKCSTKSLQCDSEEVSNYPDLEV